MQLSNLKLPSLTYLLSPTIFAIVLSTTLSAQSVVPNAMQYHSAFVITTAFTPPLDTPPIVASDRLSIQNYLNNVVSNLLQTASELPPPPPVVEMEKPVSLVATTTNPEKDVRIVDEKLYVDGKVATRYEAERYLLTHPAAPIVVDLHQDLPYEEVIENVLYINGDIASLEQAKVYMTRNPNVRLELNYQLDTQSSAKIPINSVIDNTSNISTIVVPENSTTNKPTNKLKGSGYEWVAGLIYIDGEIATRKQAEAYIAKNPKLKNKVNLNFQLQDDVPTPAAAINTSSNADVVDKEETDSYEIIQKVLYINGDIATRAEANDYITKNPKKKSLLDIKLQPDWSNSESLIIDNNLGNVATPEAVNEKSSLNYQIIDNILYVDGDIATRAEAKTYLAQHPKAKFNMSFQPEFIDDYDPIAAAESILKTAPTPTTIFSNPEIIDGKLYINGKIASAKEKASYEAATGIYIKYDKMIGDVDRSLNKLARLQAINATSPDNTTPINVPATGEKILLSKIYDEDIPCFAHYDGIWENENIFPYRYNLSQMPQRVEFLLTNGLDADFAMPCIGEVTSNFGRRWGRHHNGIDVDLETGDAVFAAFEGKVRCALYSPSFGYLVVIRHYNGLETFYAHLSALMVRPNDNVKAGTIIGLGGTTGRSTGSHLHFEVRYKGQPFDPSLIINFEEERLRKNTFTVDRYFFSSDNPNSIEDSHSNGGGQSHRKTSKGSKTTAKYHTVKKGDTLIEIAQRNRTSVRKLCALNRISSRTTLAIGRKVRIK
ncbi:MAG: peptidoglycan DD-metalloendopeptidase family protein [Chitinophagales bacterium]|nr:peptidoglycan DD-metalloendopeptidase family protein [Chitinophagales bacterium]